MPLTSYTTAGSSEIMSLMSEVQTRVPAAPPADAVGLLLVPGVVVGANAAATSSATAKMIEV